MTTRPYHLSIPFLTFFSFSSHLLSLYPLHRYNDIQFTIYPSCNRARYFYNESFADPFFTQGSV